MKSFGGGCLVAAVLFTSKFIGAKPAGILTALPLVFMISFFWGTDKGNQIFAQNYIFNVFISAMITTVFLGIFTF